MLGVMFTRCLVGKFDALGRAVLAGRHLLAVRRSAFARIDIRDGCARAIAHATVGADELAASRSNVVRATRGLVVDGRRSDVPRIGRLADCPRHVDYVRGTWPGARTGSRHWAYARVAALHSDQVAGVAPWPGLARNREVALPSLETSSCTSRPIEVTSLSRHVTSNWSIEVQSCGPRMASWRINPAGHSANALGVVGMSDGTSNRPAWLITDKSKRKRVVSVATAAQGRLSSLSLVHLPRRGGWA